MTEPSSLPPFNFTHIRDTTEEVFFEKKAEIKGHIVSRHVPKDSFAYKIRDFFVKLFDKLIGHHQEKATKTLRERTISLLSKQFGEDTVSKFSREINSYVTKRFSEAEESFHQAGSIEIKNLNEVFDKIKEDPQLIDLIKKSKTNEDAKAKAKAFVFDRLNKFEFNNPNYSDTQDELIKQKFNDIETFADQLFNQTATEKSAKIHPRFENFKEIDILQRKKLSETFKDIETSTLLDVLKVSFLNYSGEHFKREHLAGDPSLLNASLTGDPIAATFTSIKTVLEELKRREEPFVPKVVGYEKTYGPFSPGFQKDVLQKLPQEKKELLNSFLKQIRESFQQSDQELVAEIFGPLFFPDYEHARSILYDMILPQDYKID